MKLRTTTPASTSLVTRLTLVFISILTVVAVPIAMTQKAGADQYDDKINALQQNINQYQSQADILNGQAATLQSALAELANQKAALQAQIDLNQAKYDQLVIKIADTEKKIKDNQDALGETIANLYVDGKITPLEMIASSKNVSDYLDKQEYRNSVRDQLTSTIATIKDLKTQLDTQKADTQKLLVEQQSAREALVAKENEQQNLLNKTNNDEAAYQGMISSSLSQIAAAKATQAALRARTTRTGGYQLVDAGSLSGYPWGSTNCPMVGYMSTGGAPGTDGEDGYGYGCRQCVSYAAYRIAQETGYYYTDLGNGGSAGYNIVRNHADRGYKNLGNTPQPGSIAMLWGTTSPPYSNESNPGHVAWVEAVSDDGSKVLVSQYNYNYGAGWGMYSEMWLSSNFFDQYVKIK
jgi:surface antigen/peptidoglycan hydrolase CwlO-like protein